MRTIKRPVVSVYDLFDFLASWHALPTEIEPVALPPYLPKPLRDLHSRFGLHGAKEVSFDRNFETGYMAKGIFCSQDTLVPASRLEENLHTVMSGPLEGQKLLTFVHEAQWGWYLHVPLECGDDPPVLVSDTAPVNRNRPWHKDNYNTAAGRLSEFLATFSLLQTALGPPSLWVNEKGFEADDYLLAMVPIVIGAQYVYAELRYDFYIDEDESVLLMHEINTEMTYIASRHDDLQSILKDRSAIQA